MINAKTRVQRAVLPAVLVLALAGCTVPGVYKLEVQQGNIVTQEMVNQLKPGMSREQVRFIMGTPLLTDSFTNDRWDYFYSLKDSDDNYSRERLTLMFQGDTLVNMKGNFRPGGAQTGMAASTSRAGSSRGVETPTVYPLEDTRIPQ